jgi:hypothetical protein
MSEIRKFRRAKLGRTEKLFLIVISRELTSAYRISADIKNGYIITSEGIISADIKPMAYKNVRKTVKRLYSLGLIDQVEGNFKRNAKMYKLTTKGLIEQLLDVNPLLPDVFEVYKDDPIIQTLIYQYFELETIKEFETVPLMQFRRYLRSCCEAILNALDIHRYEANFIKRNTPPKSEHKVDDHDYLLPDYVNEAIKNEAKKYVFEIVKMSKDENPYQNGPNSNLYPRQALLKDSKFIDLLQEIRKEFDDGCKNYI